MDGTPEEQLERLQRNDELKDRLVQLARDLAEFEGIREDEALRRLRDMLTGDHAPFRLWADSEGKIYRG